MTEVALKVPNPTADTRTGDERSLFPSKRERVRVSALLERALADLPERIASGSVTPTLSRDDFAQELARLDEAGTRPLDELLPWIIERLQHGLVQVSHPRYFGLFNPAPSFASQCGDRIAAAFNPQLATATTSPVAVELEAHAIRRVAERAGLSPQSSGHFTSGGSEANCTALICALTAAHPHYAAIGARCFDGQPTVYISNEAHLAWIKIAHQVGIGREAVRLVLTDGSGRMSVDALASLVAEDRQQGRVPSLIVATAGTTGAGMIDPLAECGSIARQSNLWYHIDAAWAGAAIASDRLRPKLAGLECADSVTIDAHKWFATTMGCGMFITQRPAVLSNAFQVSTTFMPSNSTTLDPYVNTIQWSRRFVGIRFFLALSTVGWEGYADHVERAVGVAERIAEALTAKGWTVRNDSPVAVLCLDPPIASPDPLTIVRRVLSSGRAFVSTAMFEGRPVVRICVTHGQTSPSDVAILVEALEAACR